MPTSPQSIDTTPPTQEAFDRQSTEGLDLGEKVRPIVREAVELLSSMRFAISALTIVCIASAIGTIVPQNSPPINYVNQFGAFWAEVFTWADLFRVYNASWFILVMVLMLVSTTLCLIRTTPKMIQDYKSWQAGVNERAFPAFALRAERSVADPLDAGQALASIEQQLKAKGYQLKRQPDEKASGKPVLVAKKGGIGRLGYIAAHLSIVIISLGGLMDSELPTRMAIWWWDKEPVTLAGLTNETVPESAKLPAATPTYRGNLFIPENSSSDLAVLGQAEGSLLLELPFVLDLRQFRIEYYSTGMPKLFASDVVLTDKKTGEVREATIEVNKPLIHNGVAIYQSSFDDGGSILKLEGVPFDGAGRKELPIELEVGKTLPLAAGSEKLTLELTGFKPINVENLSGRDLGEGFQQHVATVLSPAATATAQEGLRNVGPAIQYKLRNPAGQAKEFHTYQLPVELDGKEVFLVGMRESPDQPFQYLRIPADANGTLDEFLRIRAAMADPVMRERAAQRMAREQAEAPEVRQALATTALRSLETVADTGLIGVARILEESVPEAERERAAEVVIRLVVGAFWSIWQEARVADGLEPLPSTEENQNFAQRSLNSYSDSLLLGTPLVFRVTDFQEIKASVFQVTRSPGKEMVYFGCLLLTLGVFAMLYIHERRVWIWESKDPETGATRLRMAGSSPRKSLDFDQEFGGLARTFVKESA